MTEQTKPTDGGPAFPDDRWQNGMSLRDWFAGIALASFKIAWDYSSGLSNAAAARHAYCIADAMLAERSK